MWRMIRGQRDTRNPAYLVRPPSLCARGRLPRPSPYPNFARFPPFPLFFLGGVIAVKREYVYFRVVEGGLFPLAEAN